MWLMGGYKAGCQIYGPFLGTLNIRCRIIIRTQKGTIILTTTHKYTYKVHLTLQAGFMVRSPGSLQAVLDTVADWKPQGWWSLARVFTALGCRSFRVSWFQGFVV